MTEPDSSDSILLQPEVEAEQKRQARSNKDEQDLRLRLVTLFVGDTEMGAADMVAEAKILEAYILDTVEVNPL